MKDAAFRALPAQDAVTQDKLDTLGFTVDAPVERIKSLEEAHRLARRLFCASPFVAERRPATKSGQPRWVRRELHRQGCAIPLGLLAGLHDARQTGRIVPAGLKPRTNFVGRLRRLRQLRPLNTEGKVSVGGRLRLPVGTLCFGGVRLDRALPDGGMHGQVMQPEMPGLFLDLALGRIAVLVQRLEISENTGNLFASNTKFLGFHRILHPGSVKAGMG